MNYFYYKPSGEVVEWHTGPEGLVELYDDKPGLTLGMSEDSVTDEHYIDAVTGEIHRRTEMAVILKGMKLIGVRAGAKIVIEGVEYDADGSDIDLEFNHPGVYYVTVRDWPFFDWSAEIENQA